MVHQQSTDLSTPAGAPLGIPESLIAWLFGQMLAWFGIVQYALTEDARWYVAGLVVLLITAFPIRRDD